MATNYLGETYRIDHTVIDFDTDTSLGSADVDHVYIEIFDAAWDNAVAQTDMIWDADQEVWQYDWDTSDRSPDDGFSFRIKCTVVGIDGSLSVEWKRVRLRRQPAPA